MFGGKLRSWMEAVRPKKKQHRKDKHGKLQQQQQQQQQLLQEQHQLYQQTLHRRYQYAAAAAATAAAGDGAGTAAAAGGDMEDGLGRRQHHHHHHHHHRPLGATAVSTSASSELEMLEHHYHSNSACSKSTETVATAATVATTATSASGEDRPNSGCYTSGANLSSPESAYSTGYSTDCTSPGTAPPEYYIRSSQNAQHCPPTAYTNHPGANKSQHLGSAGVCPSAVGVQNGHSRATPPPALPPKPPTHPTPMGVHSPRATHVTRLLSPHVERNGKAVGGQKQSVRNKTIHEYDEPRHIIGATPPPAPTAPAPAPVTTSAPAPRGDAPPAIIATTSSAQLQLPCCPQIVGGGSSSSSSPGGGNSAAAGATTNAITSPRQRNRIRTNPWLPGGVAVPAAGLAPSSPGSSRQQGGGGGGGVGYQHQQMEMVNGNGKVVVVNSPLTGRYHQSNILCSPIARLAGTNRAGGGVTIESLSSSSCSSLSATSLQWDAASLIGGSGRTCGTRRRHKSHHHHQSIPYTSGAKHPSRSSIPTDQEDNDEEEEDCTLNEMMGKFDESYVYEKETDILSDSDPTDCDEEDGDDDETDLDTGQDGGDELDFIDNGSYLEFSVEQQRINTQHCTYYNFETQRKMSCKKRHSSRRGKESVNGSRRSVKKRQSADAAVTTHYGDAMERNSRSAGTTPLSVRKVKSNASTVIVYGGAGGASEQYLRKRSSSVSAATRVPLSAFDQRDKEADKKYRELIVEAEHILMNMKTSNGNPPPVNGILSPVRRIPGPANKRVELLRTECAKQETYHLKSRPTDEVVLVTATPSGIIPVANAVVVSSNTIVTGNNVAAVSTKIPLPSNRYGSGCSPRFSPKRNHITNFMNNNSPILLNSSGDRNDRPHALEPPQPPPQSHHCASPLVTRKDRTRSPISQRRKGGASSPQARRSSPKYVRKQSASKSPAQQHRSNNNSSNNNNNNNNQTSDSTDSDQDSEGADRYGTVYRKCHNGTRTEYSNCPQSEPVKRKVYATSNQPCGKMMAGFNMQYDVIDGAETAAARPNSSCENLRQEALLNTITNLKRSLVDQSTSLKQVYRSSHTLQS